MRKNYFLLLAAAVLLLGCGKDEDSIKVPTSEIPVIEGYYMSSIQGDEIGVIGIPNSRNDEDGVFLSHPYPNPARGLTHVYIDIPDGFYPARLWVTPAILSGQELVTGVSDNGNYVIAGGYPVIDIPIRFPLELKRSYALVLSPGYYRVYLQCNKTLLFDNIIIY